MFGLVWFGWVWLGLVKVVWVNMELNEDRLLLIVAGTDLRAEMSDRPIAYDLRELLEQWIEVQVSKVDRLVYPLVCSDTWYLNNAELYGRPVISIGGPGVNTLSAYLYQTLHTALAIEDKLVVQMDVEFLDLRVAVWGMDNAHTLAAVELFEQKYLNDYMRAVTDGAGVDFDE